MVTKEQAIRAAEKMIWVHYGECRKIIGTRGGIEFEHESWRPSGRCRTWATRPDDFRLPLKYGMYRSGELTHTNAAMFHLETECESGGHLTVVKLPKVGTGPAPQRKKRIKDDERHYSGCICADCSGAELTAKND